jgi:hypothetical protein
MNPSMKEQLQQWKKDHQEVKRKRKRKKPKNLSERDLRDLMNNKHGHYDAAVVERTSKYKGAIT